MIGGLTAEKFSKAFAKGCNGSISINSRTLTRGSVAMFGHPDLMPLLRQAQLEGRTWYYGDKAYFGRDKYFRITKNAYMSNAQGKGCLNRWESLGIKIKDWRNGSEILLCPQSDTFFKLHGTTQADWINATSKELKKYTDRTIRVHYKMTGETERIFRRQLVNAWAVIVHSSMAGVQAAINGVPCFATDPNSTSARFGTTDLSKIETPIRPDNREQMAAVLANSQWTIPEINSGLAWEMVK
jgi:hypothetical protein